MKKALDECKEENVGYKGVIYADLIHLKRKWKPEKADAWIREYSVLSENTENHPEVLAMKGYAASFFHCYEDAITFYEGILADERTPEWVFGLTLAMQHRQVGRDDTELNEEIKRRQRSDRIGSFVRYVED